MVLPRTTLICSQYLLKLIDVYLTEYEIYCIEFDYNKDNVHRNKLLSILGDKLISLSDDKYGIIDIINEINPNVIHFQEIPETFIDNDLLKIIYRPEREYFILVSTNSHNDPKIIKFTADKFIFFSELVKNKFSEFFGDDICNLFEYKSENDDDVAILVLAHPNTEESKVILKKCLSVLKYDIILSTNYKVDEETQDMCDHVLYMKENQLLYSKDYHIYGTYYTFWYRNEKDEIFDALYEFNHNYAVYRLIQNGLKYCKMIGKKKVHIINYDYEISVVTIDFNNLILDEMDMTLYKDGSVYSTGFLSGNIDPLLDYFDKHKCLSDYYMVTSGFNSLEGQVYSHYKESDYMIEEQEFKDLYTDNKINLASIDGGNLVFKKRES